MNIVRHIKSRMYIYTVINIYLREKRHTSVKL